MNQTWKVVWDPTAEYWPGALVQSQTANQLRQRGVSLLPVERQLLKASGVGGFSKAEFGAGWEMDGYAPKRVAPLVMYCTPDFTAYHWAARLMPGPELRDGFLLDGQLRMAADSAQRTTSMVGLAPDARAAFVDIRQLGAPDEYGGWTVGGFSSGRAPGEGYYGFTLYGMANGLRVVWAAISLSMYA